MSEDVPTRGRFDVSQLAPNIFAIVMATGIVSLAANGAGLDSVALTLFGLNIAIYPVLAGLLVRRSVLCRQQLLADLTSHARAPGFFTTVAAPCVLGSQFVLLAGQPAIAVLLLGIGMIHWLALSYLMLPALITSNHKAPPEQGLSGSWLLLVVGTQAISVLASLLVPSLSAPSEFVIFIALAFWLVGSMFYLWIISQIFHRILFLPLGTKDLAPAYWINMGAMAIATLAGARLMGLTDRSELLGELLPFLKGMTLMFWATATWWIPILLVLGAWRHVSQHTPLTYEHGYWSAVFPLGMYTVSTYAAGDFFHATYLRVIGNVFVWIALGAWAATFAGLVRSLTRPQGQTRF